ncbi:MAG: hypothetical protein ACTHLN_00525 [Tepidisphaeraceae bacterium]
MLNVRPLIASTVMLALTGSLSLAATSWSTPAGSSDTITYTNGQTDTGLFTPDSPTVVSDMFIFDPANFSASSDSLITYAQPNTQALIMPSNSTSDTASTIVTAKTGRSLSHISAGLGGDYSTLGIGASDAVGTLTVTNTATHEIVTKTFDFGTQFASTSGLFNGTVSIDLPAGWKSAQIDLATTLTASAAPGSTSFVQLKSGQFGVETMKAAAVPLPPAAVAAIPAILIAANAMRRKRPA